MPPDVAIHLFGIRHHGPGCARSLNAALDDLQPEAIVLEGPADAQDALPLAAHDDMRPPVALLVYAPEDPRRAVYFPFAPFSPEWQALRWAAAHRVPVRLMDLPQSHALALAPAQDGASGEPAATERADPPGAAHGDAEEPGGGTGPTWRTDPLALLAEAAGYRDHELWWEEQVERRAHPAGLFAAILDAMRAVRDEVPETREDDLRREAFMRRTLRSVRRDGHARIAVVCGAWHAPVLDEAALDGNRPGCRATDDEARLAGLPAVRTTATWIPWTYSRLTSRSGYGAGVRSPGWYAHLWASGDGAPARWLAAAARLLREKDLDASSAGVIEAVRLADALAALRHLRAPGLVELDDALLTVLCQGQAAPLQLIRDRLEVGDLLGTIPAAAPTVPIARDLARQQAMLRFTPSAESRLVDLDVRKPTDLGRSRLLHRLHLLGVPWGARQSAGGRVSTFHEVWRLEWKPEFAVALIEASPLGLTVEQAAATKVAQDAAAATDLPVVTALLDASMLAGLTAAAAPVLERIRVMAAVGADVRRLMDALPPLARVVRYGDVRGTRAELAEPVLAGIFERVVVGLGTACASLDEDAAERMLDSVHHVTHALDLLGRGDLRDEWRGALRTLGDGGAHALIRGACCRLLLEWGAIDDDELDRRARLALSPAVPPAACAAWARGLLRGSGLLLLHQDGLWQVFDRWLNGLPADTFVEMLPLLRRAFADFTGPERRQMGEKAAGLVSGHAVTRRTPPVETSPIDRARAEQVLPVLAHVLGVEWTP
jgi:hypothetical protein